MASETALMADKAKGSGSENVAPQIISLRTQLVSEGHTRDLLAETDISTFRIHCYGPKGGENGLHAHTDEDHIFVVLQGEAQFFDLNGPLPVLRKHQALSLPKGCFYSFSNEGTEPLVMLRFGAMEKTWTGDRLDPKGKPIARPRQGCRFQAAEVHRRRILRIVTAARLRCRPSARCRPPPAAAGGRARETAHQGLRPHGGCRARARSSQRRAPAARGP